VLSIHSARKADINIAPRVAGAASTAAFGVRMCALVDVDN